MLTNIICSIHFATTAMYVYNGSRISIAQRLQRRRASLSFNLYGRSKYTVLYWNRKNCFRQPMTARLLDFDGGKVEGRKVR